MQNKHKLKALKEEPREPKEPHTTFKHKPRLDTGLSVAKTRLPVSKSVSQLKKNYAELEKVALPKPRKPTNLGRVKLRPLNEDSVYIRLYERATKKFKPNSVAMKMKYDEMAHFE